MRDVDDQWLFSGLTIIGLLLTVVGGVELIRHRRSVQELLGWIPAIGLVSGEAMDRPAATSTDDGLAPPYATVRYLDTSGRPREGKAVTPASWLGRVPGQQVALRYDPQDPGRLLLADVYHPRFLGMVLGVIFTSFGFTFVATGAVALLALSVV